MDNAQFRWRLKMVREGQGVTQARLGRVTGLKPSAVSHFESGRRLPSLPNLFRIAWALGVSTDYLLGLSSRKTISGGSAHG